MIPAACVTFNGVNGKVVRDEARDFFDTPITEGAFICYPTGGTSSRMVLAYVLAVHKGKKSAYTYSEYWYDGPRGYSNVRLKVLRLKEGIEVLEPHPQEPKRSWGINSKKKASVDQLHRVIVVDPPEWATQIVQELGHATYASNAS